MEKLPVKERMLEVLKKTEGYNTFTVKQARQRFGIKNVYARIHELRQEGHCIYRNSRTLKDGRKINFYRLGTPTKALVQAALKAGYSLG
jgi:hypothetical protein